MTKRTEAPVISCGGGFHHQHPSEEPVFHFVRRGGDHGVAGLETVRMWARGVREGLVTHREVFGELYVILPDGNSLTPCSITFAGTDDAPKLVINGTASTPGVPYTTSL